MPWPKKWYKVEGEKEELVDHEVRYLSCRLSAALMLTDHRANG